MYFPIHWPKVIRLPDLAGSTICHVMCNRDKVLIAVLSLDAIIIYYNKPCVPLVCLKRDDKSVEQYGFNQELEWRPDSSVIAVTTSKGYLSFYHLSLTANQQNLYHQRDSTTPGLRRESAELYVKDTIPAFNLKLTQTIPIDSGATGLVCIRDELMVATKLGHVLRYHWDGTLNRDYCLDLRRIPFCVDQLAARAVPVTEPNTYIIHLDYSPLLGGFAIVLNDGRGAFLTASTLKFDPNQVQGIWAPLEDATCTAINHRYRLIAFGRHNSHAGVYSIDESTGGLQVSHILQLSSRDFPGCPGSVQLMKWSADGSCLALSWSQGAISLWSTFGALLLCTLNWDFGPNHDPSGVHPLILHSLDWGIEGYQLWMLSKTPTGNLNKDNLILMEMVKSPLTANPCMGSRERLYLHGEDRVYINVSDGVTQMSSWSSSGSNNSCSDPGVLLSSKQWLMVQVPNGYMAGNWPLRFVALDASCENLAVAGRTGFAFYSFVTRRWKLFGNESQEKDFVVTGGLLWWKQQLILGCYNIAADKDEIRIYPRDSPRLDNAFCSSTVVAEQILLISAMRDHLLIYTADCHINLFDLEQRENPHTSVPAFLTKKQEIDVSTLGLHPACLVAATLTTLSTEPHRVYSTEKQQNEQSVENILLNVCGRVLLIQREIVHGSDDNSDVISSFSAPTVLASCVETLWVPNPGSVCPRKPHLTQALWLCCGAHGMRVWLPLYPRDGDKGHTFMSKRIMLPFQLYIYPLSVLFEEAILLGVETDTVHYPSTGKNDWLRKMPYCILERNSQVYLHHIFRQLIRRNLGFHAWEIARGCTDLPYFSHSLELLLHEVLEEEATSKEPIPDALLPSVLEFIQEFPVYLTTIVQCARKTEVALWPYLFGAAANPRTLFQRCLETKQLEIAASYLIILQNMEPVALSRQYATILLNAALDNCCWDLSKDLVRFLRAIDPNDVETSSFKAGSAPTTAAILASKIHLGSQTPPISPNTEDLNFLLGSFHVHRGRSHSTTSGLKSPVTEIQHREITRSASDGKTPPGQAMNSRTEAGGSNGKPAVNRKKSAPVMTNPITIPNDDNQSAEEFFLDGILHRHSRQLLSAGRLLDLGYLVAHLDCPLVTWLGREKYRAAKIEDFVLALRRLHADFQWPFPSLPGGYSARKSSVVSRTSSNGVADKLQALEVDVTNSIPYVPIRPVHPQRIGDSGYLSNIGNGNLNHSEGLLSVSQPTVNHVNTHSGLLLQAVEAQLKPNPAKVEEGSIISEGEETSLWGEERAFDGDSLHESTWSLHSTIADIDAWSNTSCESAAKGPPQSEVQLRYLLQLFFEAECLDWGLVLAVILRDAMAVLRVVSVARSILINSPSASNTQNLETVTRLRDGLLALSHWSDTDCHGYRPFMNAIYGQVGVLTKLIIPQKTPTSPTTPITDNQRSMTSPKIDYVETVRQRNLSVPMNTPLGSVEEAEEISDLVMPSRDIEHSKDWKNASTESLAGSQSSMPSELDRASETVHHPEEIRQSSSCTIS